MLTIKEVLEITVNQLGTISVPVALHEQIGVPVARAMGNLQECLKAINNAENAGEEDPDERETDAE